MPFGQSTKGGQTTLDPTPSASLAPMASYTMVDPGARGPPGAVGLSAAEPQLAAAGRQPQNKDRKRDP